MRRPMLQCCAPNLAQRGRIKMPARSLLNRTSAARLPGAGPAPLLWAGWSVAGEAPAAPSVTALLCGHLIDTIAGKVLGETIIVIESGHVREVLNGTQAPAGATA